MDAPNDVRKYNKYNSRDAAKQRRAERRFLKYLKKEPPSRSFMETPTSKQKAIAVNHLANHLQQEARAAKPSADGTRWTIDDAKRATPTPVGSMGRMPDELSSNTHG